jgi:hypothetical protein
MILKKHNFIICLLLAMFFIPTANISADEMQAEKKTVVQTVNEKKDTGFGYYDGEQWKKLSLGVSTAVGYGYYRRGFAVVADSTLPIHIIKGLYIAPGIRFIAHKFNLSHFFSIATGGTYNYKFDGCFVGIKADVLYRQQIIKYFGLQFGLSFSIGPEFSDYYSPYRMKNYPTISLTFSPDIFIGAYANYKNWAFFLNFKKLFPFNPVVYNTAENFFYSEEHFGSWDDFTPPIYKNLSTGYHVCFSAASMEIGFTYFFPTAGKKQN